MAAKKGSNSKKSSDSSDEVKKTVAKKKTASKSSSGNGGMSFFKMLLFAVMALIIVVLGGFVYLLVNLDSYKVKMADAIEFELDSVKVDPSKLIEKTTKLRMCFKIKNSLPLDVVYKSMNFDITLSDTKLANNMLADVNATLHPNASSSVNIACNVDSIVARRAIQKALEKNAVKLLKSVLSQKDVNSALADDIKAISSIKGTANLILKMGALEVPFEKKLSF